MNVHDGILKEYEKRRKRADDELELRKNEVYSKIPRIEEIDNQIKLIGLQYSKMILFKTGFHNELSEELALKVDVLKKEKLRLLEENGYKPDYLELAYACPQCNDTGFRPTAAGSEMCGCYKQQLIEKLFYQSNLANIHKENFSRFNPDLYPDVVDEAKYKIKVSPRRRILSIKERCLRFVENFGLPDEQNLFFVGPTGVGKTFMANCIAYELLNRGVSVLYQTAPAMFEAIRRYKIRESGDNGAEDEKYRLIFEVELLIIDDLGTESYTSSKAEDLLNVLNARLSADAAKPCKTIISSNIPVKTLYEYYTERVASRIMGKFSILQFAGDDIRTLEKASRK